MFSSTFVSIRRVAPRCLLSIPPASLLHRQFSILEETRSRLLAPLRNQLTFQGWEEKEAEAATKAANYIPKVLGLSQKELHKLATSLAASGNESCQQSLNATDIQKEAETIALAFFEVQYARHLTDMLQKNTDFWGARDAVPACECSSDLAANVVTASVVEEYVRTGLCVIDDVLDEKMIIDARDELLSVHVSGELKTVDFQKDNNVRNDLVGWLDTSSVSKSVHAQKLKPIFDLLRGVPAEIERHSSQRFSVPALAQAALYNGSQEEPSFYHNHLDCGDPKTNPRRLTALLYLNPGFDAERDGGWLRAQLPNGGGLIDVEPKGGRLLLFNSCDVEHQVLPATAPRFAVTLWAFAPMGMDM